MYRAEDVVPSYFDLSCKRQRPTKLYKHSDNQVTDRSESADLGVRPDELHLLDKGSGAESPHVRKETTTHENNTVKITNERCQIDKIMQLVIRNSRSYDPGDLARVCWK
jgi:hypothetical protein